MHIFSTKWWESMNYYWGMEVMFGRLTTCMEKMELNQTQMEEMQMQLDGKMSNVFLSTTNNVVGLTKLKNMTMNIGGKMLNPILTTSTSNPESIL
jgi:hypothetical protein